MRFTPRIVLSACLIFLLAASSAAFADSAPVDHTDNGIGTSPSYELMCAAAPAPCGVWVDDSAQFADQRARAGDAPDVVVFTQGHTTCSDAISISALLWPEASVVFEVASVWRAKVADYHPPTVAPAMMEWRGPAPSTMHVPEPQTAALPFLAPLAAFALSKEGLLLIGSALTWIWHKAVKDNSRRDRIAGYTEQAFHAAEAMGVYKKLDGQGKYKAFVEMVVDALKADKAPDLSAKEMAGLTEMAKRKAWIGKLLVPPTSSASGR